MNALEIAKRTIHQWDNYGECHWTHVEGDESEPDGVTMARVFVKLCEDLKSLPRFDIYEWDGIEERIPDQRDGALIDAYKMIELIPQ